ncbi:MAG TPA: hypothetical protein VK426_04605 [Methanobacterium sp.]|nr:hypothetical protein [Methanobacterium sp.]
MKMDINKVKNGLYYVLDVHAQSSRVKYLKSAFGNLLDTKI